MDDDAFSVFFANGGNAIFVDPRSASVDPIAQHPSLFFAETIVFLGRHFKVRIFPSDGLHHKTEFGVARDEHIVEEFASFEHFCSSRQVELALDFIRIVSVAGKALVGQNGHNLQGEELFSFAEFLFSGYGKAIEQDQKDWRGYRTNRH